MQSTLNHTKAYLILSITGELVKLNPSIVHSMPANESGSSVYS